MLLGVCASLFATVVTAWSDLPIGDWKPVGPGNAGQLLGTVTDPTNESHTVAVSYGYYGYGYYGLGLIETRDGGASWTNWTVASPQVVYAFSAFDHRRMYGITGSYQTNLYCTTDGGHSWNLVGIPVVNYGRMTTVCAHPTDSNTVFTAGYTYISSVYYFMFGKSTNGGLSWTVSTHSSPGADARPTKLVVSRSNPQRLLATGDGNGTCWVSSNGGVSWSVLSGKGGICAAIDPTDDRRMYLTGASGSFYSSTDAGVTWQSKTTVSNIYCLGIDPLNPANIYGAYGPTNANVAVTMGVVVSRDYGATWSNCPGVISSYKSYIPTGVEVMAANPSNVLVATDDGLFISRDAGRTWSRGDARAYASTPRSLSVAPSRPSRIMQLTDAGLFRSDNGGDDWTSNLVRQDNVTFSYRNDLLTSAAIDPANPDRILLVGKS
jgi:photosystem II stability/assembly factor-like uncharacterized protein